MSGAATAIAIGAGVSAAGALGGDALSSNAAGNAADQQSAAANHAADLQYQASQNALGFQEGQYNNSQAELAPWLQSGAGALTNLDSLLGIGQPSSTAASPAGTAAYPQSNLATSSGPVLPTSGAGATGVPGSTGTPGINGAPSLTSTPNPGLGAPGSLLSPYPGGQFSAPTAEEAAKTPGYQFQLQQGNQALQQSAAARGNLLTGGTAEALDNYSQGLAASNYQNTYNNALNTYGTNYNTYNNDQTNKYNRLAALSGTGQTAANTLGTLGQNSANGISSNLLNTANSMGQQYNNAAAANASGLVGSANAWSGALGSTGNNLSQLALLQSILGGGGGSVPNAPMSMYGG